MPSILWHQGRCNPSPREGEGNALASGEGYLKNVQKELTLHLQYQPKTSYLSPHPTGCGRRVSMTLLPTATLLCLLASRENPRPRHLSFSGLSRVSSLNRDLCNNKANLLTRLETRCQRILGTRPRMTGAWDSALVPVNRLLRFARNDGRVKCEAVILLLCWLLPKVSFFLPNPAKTC